MDELFNINDPNNPHEIPEGTQLLAYRGSIAHNMYVPSTDPNSIDDVDLMGVVIAPKNCYLGLSQWGSRGTREFKQGRYDCVYYEIRKAFSLLLQGNPNIVSLLWVRTSDYIIQTEIGREIVRHRDLFHGKHIYNAFAGYASAQLQKMETRDPAELREYLSVTAELKARGLHPNHKGEHIDPPSDHPAEYAVWGSDALLRKLAHYHKKGENIGYMGDKRKHLVLEHGFDAKNAAHCIRLLRMAEEYFQQGVMNAYREDAAELLDIKRGKWPLERIKEHAEEMFARVKVARDKSSLPDGPNREAIEGVMIGILENHFYWKCY